MKIVLQDGIKDCGVCSLLSIIRYYGGDVSKEYLRELTNTTKSGVSAYKLLEGAEKIGFTGYGVNGDLENIDKNNLPCLAHLIINKSYQHFVVIYDIDLYHKKILIMDPAKGKKLLSFSEFRLLSSGNFIYLKPTKKLPIFSYDKIIVNNIKDFLIKNKYGAINIILLSLIYFVINIITVFHFKYLLEYVINYSYLSNLYIISFFLFSSYIFKEIILYIRNILLLKWIDRFDYIVTSNTIKRIIFLPYLYYKSRTTGEVTSRIRDLSIIKNFIVKLLCFVTTDLTTIIVFSFFLFNISFKMTVFSLIIIFILFLYNFFISFYKRKNMKINNDNSDSVNSFIIESLTSVDALKGLHIEKNIIKRFKSKYKTYLASSYKLSLIYEFDLFFKNNINNLLLVCIYGMGAYFVTNNSITIASLIVYQGIFNYFINALNNICDIQKEWSIYKSARERIEDMFTIKEEKFIGSNYYNLYTLNGDIKYTNLSYSYNSTLLFNKLNLTIKKQTHILLTGASGMGKSTLVKMLMGYINVPFGSIKINNIDISHYHLDVLRNRITYVTGNEFLFSNTIYNNISLNRDISKESVYDVAKLVLVDEVVLKNSLGYQRMVEENGFNFSGGERQRIVLARTLLKDSDIYIFDESLSQIDVEKERIILKNIFKYLKDKTIIVVSHRFNNSDLFDKVLRLENGDVYET